MKNIMIAATVSALLASSATAADLAFVGGLEYTTEAGVFEATAGVEYNLNQIVLASSLTVNDADGDFEFTGADFTVGYTINDASSVYVTVDADADFNRTETTLGLSVRF